MSEILSFFFDDGDEAAVVVEVFVLKIVRRVNIILGGGRGILNNDGSFFTGLRVHKLGLFVFFFVG